MEEKKIWQSAGGKARGIIQRKEAIERYYLNPVICKQCGEIIKIRENERVQDVKSRFFCNHSCSAKFLHENKEKIIKPIKITRKKNLLILENVTKKELFEKRANWQSARSTIQKEARVLYNKSDKFKGCAICGYTNHYEICHIKSVSSFPPDALIVKEINNINNLIALCPNHHWEFDNDILKLTVLN